MIAFALLTMANVAASDVLPSPASRIDRPRLVVRKPASAKPVKTSENNALDAWARSLEGAGQAPDKPAAEEPKKTSGKEPEVIKPVEAVKPVEIQKPVEVQKPVEAQKPAKGNEPVADGKPAAAKQKAAAEKPISLPPPSNQDLAIVEKPAKAVGQAAPVKLVEKKSSKGGDEARSVKITSNRADADRKQGVILFDGNVFVDDSEYQMHSDRLYVFLEGTNELKRIVAVGNVAITNDNKMGYCAKATYSKEKSRIVMYGDGPVVARLVDNSKKKSEVAGSKITFWVDSDQVEVENSTVTLDAGGAGMKDQAKKLRNNGK